MNNPIPRPIWHPLTWLIHGAIQYGIASLSIWAGWTMLAVWYYRDRYKDHRGHWLDRWPLDGWMDVGVPVVIQLFMAWKLYL